MIHPLRSVSLIGKHMAHPALAHSLERVTSYARQALTGNRARLCTVFCCNDVAFPVLKDMAPSLAFDVLPVEDDMQNFIVTSRVVGRCTYLIGRIHTSFHTDRHKACALHVSWWAFRADKP